jgi:tryptophan 7-halogenase
MPANAREPLRTIAIVGAGATGLTAAIALRRVLPHCAIILVPAPADPAALADEAVTFTPQSNAFHRRFGIDEDGLIVRAGASHRLAIEMAGWTGANSMSLHPYGAAPPDGVDALAVPAAVAAESRFAYPSDDRASPLSDIDYALRISPRAYRRHLSALAARIGIDCRGPQFAAAVADNAGEIAHLMLSDGAEVRADLYVDCTGPEALVASALPPKTRSDWSKMLPCDRLLLPEESRPPQLTPVDRITATALGWRGEVHGRDGTHSVFAASSTIGSPEALAHAAGFEPATIVTINQGRRMSIWQANVVCIGDAAVQLEPLHWLNSALAHAQITLLVELLPGRKTEPLERNEFNRRAGDMADRVRDYVALHYSALQKAQGPFWRHTTELLQPESLKLTLAEYARRGRLPFFEEDIMPRDAWVFAMGTIGQSPEPAARLLAIPPASLAALADVQRARAKAAVQMAQPYPLWLATHLKAAQ